MERLPSRFVKPKGTPLVVLLTTPCHMELIEEDSRFVPDILRQTHGGIGRGQVIDVLLAVVDKIPLPAFRQESIPNIEKYRRFVGYTRNGVSVLLLDSTAAPDLWSDGNPTTDRTSSSVRRRSALSFQFDAQGSRDGKYLSRTVKLPVSTTIFKNGRNSTIQAQRWTVSEETPEPTFACVERLYLHDPVIRVPTSHMSMLRTDEKFDPQLTSDCKEDFLNGHFVRFAVPLESITQPRIVAGAMGNVVRSLFADGSSGSVIAASQELEAAVTREISKNGAEQQAIQVWALVSPPTRGQPLDRLSQVGVARFLTLLDEGSHLHKASVLSPDVAPMILC